MSLFDKRALLAGAIALVLFPCAAAQTADSQQNDKVRVRQQQQRRLAVLAQRLNLTAEQKQQWLRIQRETTQKSRAARKDDSLSEEQMQARLKEIHKQQKEQMLATLSPEQQESLKAFSEEQRQKQQSDKAPDTGTPSDSSAQSKENEKEDDLFAGMVSDDPVPPPQPQSKRTARK